MRYALGATLLLLLCSDASAQQDRVELRNGDVLSGAVVKMEGGKLTLNTDYAGDITIDWAEVVAIETGTRSRVELTSGEAVAAQFIRKDDGVYLQSPEVAGVQPLPLSEVASIGLPYGPTWGGSIAVAVGGTSGNTRTTSFGVIADTERLTKSDLLRFDLRVDNQTRRGRQEVQSTAGRGVYEYSLTRSWFLSALATLEHDRFKDIRLRSRAGGGPGYQIIKTPTMGLKGYVGAVYVNEDFRVEEDRDFVSALIGEAFAWQISDTQSFRELFELYPNLEDSKAWVAHFEAAFRQIVTGGIFLEANFLADYDNDPALDKTKDDLTYGLTLGYQF